VGKVLIIGYGNPLRGDDGLGAAAAQRLEELLHDNETVVMVRHQMGVELAMELSEAGLVIFMDARVGGAPGQLAEEKVIPEISVPSSFSHHLQPGVLLSVVQALYNKCPEAYLYSVSAESFEHGEGLSPVVAAALPALVDKVLARVSSFRAGK